MQWLAIPFLLAAKFSIWSTERGDNQDVKDVMQKMSNVIEASRERMKAEFHGSLQMDFSAFSFRRWNSSRNVVPSSRANFEANLHLKLKRLFKAANCDPIAGCRQFIQVINILYQEFKAQLRDQLPNQWPDNRVLWRRAFQEDVRSQANREGDISVLCWGLTTLLHYQLVCCESALGCNRLVLWQRRVRNWNVKHNTVLSHSIVCQIHIETIVL